mmetsp:Transcript_102177/g.202847  ORF Transcript_102177/g.202847 Transcript_102177/m.202847 type:complete len:229 (-) Transcript_102177:206-892(-)
MRTMLLLLLLLLLRLQLWMWQRLVPQEKRKKNQAKRLLVALRNWLLAGCRSCCRCPHVCLPCSPCGQPDQDACEGCRHTYWQENGGKLHFFLIPDPRWQQLANTRKSPCDDGVFHEGTNRSGHYGAFLRSQPPLQRCYKGSFVEPDLKISLSTVSWWQYREFDQNLLVNMLWPWTASRSVFWIYAAVLAMDPEDRNLPWFDMCCGAQVIVEPPQKLSKGPVSCSVQLL